MINGIPLRFRLIFIHILIFCLITLPIIIVFNCPIIRSIFKNIFQVATHSSEKLQKVKQFKLINKNYFCPVYTFTYKFMRPRIKSCKPLIKLFNNWLSGTKYMGNLKCMHNNIVT